jgi:hypothetical protein
MSFYFTIIDDTDDSLLENTKPIYDFLYDNKIYITKTIWVYPPRDEQSHGDSLQNAGYLEFIKDIKRKGFEIGIHNVGSGDYTRDEILAGIKEYKDKLGDYPAIHINHSYNKDSIYGGYKRFNAPNDYLVKKLYPQYSGVFQGENRGSDYFWGDKHKELIRFSRNHEFEGINTRKYDPYMPYVDSKRQEFANYWYSATFAPNPLVYNRVVTAKNIDRLEKECGMCILFTHLGYFMRDGKIDNGFKESIKYLSSNRNGIYLPITKILNEIANSRIMRGNEPYPVIPLHYKFRMEILHLLTRLKYRKIHKIDDYAFKGLNKDMFINK